MIRVGECPTGGARLVSDRQRRKVLILGDDSSRRGLLSAFLTSMGCDCIAASSSQGRAMIQSREFDATVIDLRPPSLPMERLLLEIKEQSPELLRRMLVITAPMAERSTILLIESLELARVSHHQLFQQLWGSLEGVFGSRLRQPSGTRGTRLAQLIFDSFLQPLAFGVRSLRPSARHLLYKSEEVMVDLLIEPLPPRERVAVTGQVLNAPGRKVRNDNLLVVFTGAGGPRAVAITNHWGEFNLECNTAKNPAIKVRLEEDSWVFIPLGELSWAGKQSGGA